MIIDSYIVPDDLEIEELTTKKGVTFYASGSAIALSRAGVLLNFATGRICEQCGKATQGPYHTLCFACEQKAKRERYLKIPAVPYHGQLVFVDDELVGDLEEHLMSLLEFDCSEDVLNFEIMEAEVMEVPSFSMEDFLEEYLCEDSWCSSDYDKAINALIKDAADSTYTFTYGKNRVEIPDELVAKIKEAVGYESKD